MWKCMFFHKWSSWEIIKVRLISNNKEIDVQERKCIRCGLIKRIPVS